MKTKMTKYTEALERQAKYDAMTNSQKIEKLDRGGYVAKKERTRLER